MNIDKLKSAIIAAGVSRNIIEAGAPVTDETLLNIVACLGMGPKIAQPSQEPELESMTRMFHAACADLGLINEALGLDPDDGGAEPILYAIEELKKRAPQPSAPVAQAVPAEWRKFVEDCSKTAGCMVEGNNLSRLAFRLLSTAPQVEQVEAKEGWKLVPVEADDDMVSAACEAANLFRVDAVRAIEAAIAAAPSSQKEE